MRHAHRFGDGHRRQLHPVDDITNGQNVRYRAAVGLVHQHGTVAAQLNPAFHQSQALDVWAASSGEHHQVGAQRTAIGQRHEPLLAIEFDVHHLGVELQDNALLNQLLSDEFPHPIIKPAQEQRAAIGQSGLSAEAGEDAGELHGDVAAADHEDPAREARQVEGVIGTDDVLGAGKLRHPRTAAGGHQDPFSGV